MVSDHRNKVVSISMEKSKTLNEKVALNDVTLRLHGLLQQLPRYKKEDISKISFDDGICFFFEDGEIYHDFDRIVRVGAHIVDSKLKQRLRDHYKHNQEGSAFRKSIGKAMLRYDQYKFEELLDLEFSKGKSPNRVKKYEKEKNMEQRITRYLNDRFSFVCVKVVEKELRLRLVEGLIALLHNTEDFKPSSQWFGRYSPNEEIRVSGLWLREGVNYVPLTKEEIQMLEVLIWESIQEYKSETGNKGTVG